MPNPYRPSWYVFHCRIVNLFKFLRVILDCRPVQIARQNIPKHMKCTGPRACLKPLGIRDPDPTACGGCVGPSWTFTMRPSVDSRSQHRIPGGAGPYIPLFTQRSNCRAVSAQCFKQASVRSIFCFTLLKCLQSYVSPDRIPNILDC